MGMREREKDRGREIETLKREFFWLSNDLITFLGERHICIDKKFPTFKHKSAFRKAQCTVVHLSDPKIKKFDGDRGRFFAQTTKIIVKNPRKIRFFSKKQEKTTFLKKELMKNHVFPSSGKSSTTQTD